MVPVRDPARTVGREDTIEISDVVTDDGPADDASVSLSERSRGNHTGATLCYPVVDSLVLLRLPTGAFRLPDWELFSVLSSNPATHANATPCAPSEPTSAISQFAISVPTYLSPIRSKCIIPRPLPDLRSHGL